MEEKEKETESAAFGGKENTATPALSTRQITFLDGDACRYPVVRAAAAKMGWRLVGNKHNDKNKHKSNNAHQNCNVLWVDVSILADYFLLVQPWQCINHFPGMVNIARKTRLAQNLEAMRRVFPTRYNFAPQTYSLPKDLTALRSQHFTLDKGRKSRHVWIIKPDGGAKGKGIFLTRDLEEIQGAIARSDSQFVAQRYIARPMLIDNKKFDLRLYVLVTSCDPLRVYLFRDGLCRLCTVDFVQTAEGSGDGGTVGDEAGKKGKSANLKDRCAHLTNYSVNKRSEAFVRDEECSVDDETGDIRTGGDSGSKRSVSWLLSWLREKHGDAAVDRLWCSIGDICVKTILSILPTLVAEYQSTFGGDVTNGSNNDKKNQKEASSTSSNGLSGSRCFEVLGFDIMLDEKLQPYLIEVNHLPSFGTDAPLDKAIKSKVIEQAMSVVQAKPDDRRMYEKAQRHKSRHRLVNRLGAGTLLGRRDPYEDDENDENDGIDPHMLRLHRPAGPQHVLPPTAEAILTSLYREHCPEKIDRVPAMLIKYRGYEDWLIAKVRERYCNPAENDGSSNGAGEEEGADVPIHEALERDGEDDLSDDDDDVRRYDDAKWSEEERLLKDYGRIYPPQPSRKRPFPKPPYNAMKKHVFEESAKQVERMTVPLYQARANDADPDVDGPAAHLAKLAQLTPHSGTSSRADYFQRGSLHLRRSLGPVKIRHPPTKRQIESFDRLSRGMNANTDDGNFSATISSENDRRTADPFTTALQMAEREASMLSTKRWDLVQRVRQELDEAKGRRQRNQGQLDRSRLGVNVRSLDFDLGPLGSRLRVGALTTNIANIRHRRSRSRYMTH